MEAKSRLRSANRAGKRQKSAMMMEPLMDVDVEESQKPSKTAKKGHTNTYQELNQEEFQKQLTKQVAEVLRKEFAESKGETKHKVATPPAEDFKSMVNKEVEEVLRKESARLRQQEEMAKQLQDKLAAKEQENTNLKLSQERARIDAVMAHMAEMEAIRKQAEQDKVDKAKAEAEREHWRLMALSKEAMEKEKLEFTLKMHAEAKLSNQASL